jgi:hypothetical protein
MAHIERINWTDSVPDAVAKIAEGNIRGGSMHYGPDETLRRNRPFELPKSNRTRYAVRQQDIWTKRMVIFKTSANRTMQECSQCCVPHTVKHAFKRSIVGGFKQSTEMKEK